MKLRSDQRGMSLIEVMVGSVILVVASLLLVSGFLSVNSIMGKGDRVQVNGQLAAGAIEGEADTDSKVENDQEGTQLSFDFYGTQFQYNGRYDSYTAGGEKDAQLSTFNTEAFVSAKSMYKKMKEMPDFWDTLSDAEFKELGIVKWKKNDNLREYMRRYTYGGAWPIFDPSKLPESFQATGKDFYIQPFMYEPCGPDADVIIFAVPSQASNWYTGLIYDHEEDSWYYTDKKNFSINSVPGRWPEIKERIHSDGWYKLG